MKILAFEDDKTTAMLLQLILNRQDVEVVVSPNAVDAVTRVREEQPDLILMDILMPEIDGLTAAAEIRDNPDLAEIPIIAVSATSGKYEESALLAGCDGFLKKPFTYDEFLGVVHNFTDFDW